MYDTQGNKVAHYQGAEIKAKRIRPEERDCKYRGKDVSGGSSRQVAGGRFVIVRDQAVTDERNGRADLPSCRCIYCPPPGCWDRLPTLFLSTTNVPVSTN